MHDLPYPVTDIHVHIQPWEQLHPGARTVMSRGRPDYDALERMMHDGAAVLERMDAAGIDRIGMINYVAPRLMGFTDEVNVWVAGIARTDPRRLLAFGGLDPRDPEVINDPRGAVDRLVDLGIRGLKIHPPHQELRVNAYREGAAEEHLPALAGIYARAQEVGLPLMVHTGTSVFPGARSRYGDPMDCDDVGIDFPELTMILAHCGRPMWTASGVFIIRRFPNAYIDLSSIPPKRLLHYIPALEKLAPKCLWGTDWPGPGAPTMDHNLRQFLDIGLSDEARKAILHDNAARLFPL
ncbi:MAG: amidohydrolase family protein [Acidobacteriota bacterium]